MIYLDSSVLLAQLWAEDIVPDPAFWSQSQLITSRLTAYEVWTRVHARAAGVEVRQAVTELLGSLSFLELTSAVLARALEPFPLPLRTLDALHLASAVYLKNIGLEVAVATYDRRVKSAANALGIALAAV